MLGSDQPLSWTRDEEGLKVKLPAEKPCEHAYTLKLIF
jgi:alpha-L-fucosidase